MSEQMTEQTTENGQIMTIYKNCIKNLGTTVTAYFYNLKKNLIFKSHGIHAIFKYQNTDLLEKM